MTPAAEAPSGTQAMHLRRVRSRIAPAIVAFIAGRTSFHADDLRAHVLAVCGTVAPASADRVLRDLRKSGEINYRVTNRRGSLYEVLNPPAAALPLDRDSDAAPLRAAQAAAGVLSTVAVR